MVFKDHYKIHLLIKKNSKFLKKKKIKLNQNKLKKLLQKENFRSLDYE